MNDRMLSKGMDLKSFKVLITCMFFLVYFVTGCRSLGDSPLVNLTVTNDSLEQPFQALDNLDPKIREMGAYALGRLSPIKNNYMETYIRSLNLSDDEKTMKAIEEMGELATNMGPVVDALVNSARDYDSNVRFESLNSLQLIYDQLILIIGPLNELETLYANEKEQIVKAAEKTLDISSGLKVKINNTMNSALNEPLRKIRKTAEKFMVRSKLKPKQFVIAGAKTTEDVKVEEQPQVDIKTDDKISSDTKINENPEPENIATVEPPPETTEKTDEKADPIKFIGRFLKQLESFELANRRFALLAMAPYIEKELSPVEETIGSVKKGVIALRIEAADSIVERVDRMGDVVAALCHVTDDVDSDMRIKSLKNIGNIVYFLSGALNPFEKAPKEIEDVLTKENAEVEQLVRIQIDQFKKSAEQGIRKITQMLADTIPVLLKSLDDNDIEVRSAAGEGLRSILSRSEEITPLNPVWEAVFQKVKLTSNDIKIRLLMNDLANPGVESARNAARAIGDMGAVAKNAVPTLIKVIRNKENMHAHYKYVQMDAMAALGSMGATAEEAVPVLMDQLVDIRFEIRSAAVLALGRIGGKNGTSMVLEMLEKDKSSLVRESAAQALSNMDPVECVEKVYVVLFKALKDPSNEIRMNAFKTLAAYELLNKGAGVIMWKASEKDVNGYQVCSGKGQTSADCIDAGMTTIFRLGDFKNIPREGKGVEVKALLSATTENVEFKFVDIMSLLEKSASNEKVPVLKEKKNKALLELMKNLIK